MSLSQTGFSKLSFIICSFQKKLCQARFTKLHFKEIQNGHLNMEVVLERLVIHFNDLYSDSKKSFLEEAGRRYFLLYLKPIINGTGNYYIEAQTRNMEHTDVIIDYNGEQFIVKLKLWRGDAYNERGEEQLSDYLHHYHLKEGYMSLQLGTGYF